MQSKYANFGVSNGFFGKKHSAATRLKMRAAWKLKRQERVAILKEAGANRAANSVLKEKQIKRNKEMAKNPAWRKAVGARLPYGVSKLPGKKGRKSKTILQYEGEAKRNKNGCLIHSVHGVARKIYGMRHGPYFPRGNSGGLRVCHKCDNPKCIEDSHHFLGTQKDNVQDAVKKGRHSGFRKGGTRFKGNHSKETKAKIAAASRRMWRLRREN